MEIDSGTNSESEDAFWPRSNLCENPNKNIIKSIASTTYLTIWLHSLIVIARLEFETLEICNIVKYSKFPQYKIVFRVWILYVIEGDTCAVNRPWITSPYAQLMSLPGQAKQVENTPPLPSEGSISELHRSCPGAYRQRLLVLVPARVICPLPQVSTRQSRMPDQINYLCYL